MKSKRRSAYAISTPAAASRPLRRLGRALAVKEVSTPAGLVAGVLIAVREIVVEIGQVEETVPTVVLVSRSILGSPSSAK
jgi:hypothetical protein